MIQLLPYFLIFFSMVVVFTVGLKFTIKIVGKTFGKNINKKHKAAEKIITTGEIPSYWINEIDKNKNFTQKKILLLKKIDDLIRYFETSPAVANENTRKILIKKLQINRKFWAEEQLEEILK